jgi:hypothetical protein
VGFGARNGSDGVGAVMLIGLAAVTLWCLGLRDLWVGQVSGHLLVLERILSGVILFWLLLLACMTALEGHLLTSLGISLLGQSWLLRQGLGALVGSKAGFLSVVIVTCGYLMVASLGVVGVVLGLRRGEGWIRGLNGARRAGREVPAWLEPDRGTEAGAAEVPLNQGVAVLALMGEVLNVHLLATLAGLPPPMLVAVSGGLLMILWLAFGVSMWRVWGKRAWDLRRDGG